MFSKAYNYSSLIYFKKIIHHAKLKFSVSSILKQNLSVVTDDKTGISILTMSKSPVNSLSLDFLSELNQSIDKLNMEKNCKGIIITSSLGKVFCSGLDIFEMYEAKAERLEKFWNEFQQMWLNIYSSPKAFMAAINGHAPAGGCIMSLCTDYRIMSPNFKIGLNETLLGIVAPVWAEDVLRATIGNRATEYSLQLGKTYTSDEALKIKLVDEIASDPLQSCMNEMNNWLVIPEHARALTKLQMRDKLIGKMKRRRQEDTENFVKFIQKEGVQKALSTYLTNLKNRKKD